MSDRTVGIILVDNVNLRDTVAFFGKTNCHNPIVSWSATRIICHINLSFVSCMNVVRVATLGME